MICSIFMALRAIYFQAIILRDSVYALLSNLTLAEVSAISVRGGSGGGGGSFRAALRVSTSGPRAGWDGLGWVGSAGSPEQSRAVAAWRPANADMGW